MKEFTNPRALSAVSVLLNNPRTVMESIVGQNSIAVMAAAAGQLSKIEGLLIIAPRAYHNQWGRELKEYGGLEPLEYVLTTAPQLLDHARRGRYKVLRNVIVNHVHTGTATESAIAEIANAAKRVWIRNIDDTPLNFKAFAGVYLRCKL